MAKKPRTPPPPRVKQQGPRRREVKRDASGFVSGRNVVLAAVALGSIALAIVLGIVLFGGRGNGGAGSAALAKKLAAVGCVLKTYPSLGQSHVQSLDATVRYNSFPPTSGPHYQQPALWNRYTDPLSLVQQVHNLEHGGVIIQYGDKVPSSTVDLLRSFYDSGPNGMLLAPLPKLGDKIALSAWTHLATCAGYNKTALTAFRDAYRGKGPERIPVSALKPGS